MDAWRPNRQLHPRAIHGFIEALTCADIHGSKNVQTNRNRTPDEIAATM